MPDDNVFLMSDDLSTDQIYVLTGKNNPIIIQTRTNPAVLTGAPVEFPGHILVKCQLAGKFIPNFPDDLRVAGVRNLPK